MLLFLACNGGAEPSVLDAVTETESHYLPGLRCEAQVLRTEGNVPHIYARDREDLARAMGFTLARDRYFEMELASRLALGTVSELLGADALESDMESRSAGMTHVADTILANLTPEQERIFDAFAEGVNAYVLGVATGELDPPSELEIAVGLLGAEEPVDLMGTWDRRTVAGVGATVIYNLGYETGDMGRARTEAALPGLFDDAPLGELRQAGVYEDIWWRLAPVHPISSAPDWPAAVARKEGRPHGRVNVPWVEAGVLDRAWNHGANIRDRFGHDFDTSWGSNAWAVAGTHSPDGRSILASDGHLPLDIPSLFYQLGLDTSVLGGGDTHQLGTTIPGMPYMAVGTNGDVAWSQTQLLGDQTDWFQEQVQLGDDGMPSASLFEGAWQPMVRHEESIEVADVPLLGSEGRTVSFARFETFDGRWLYSIEGTPSSEGEGLALNGDWIVPGDIDGDGLVTAITFDYAALDDQNILGAVDAFGHSGDVQEFAEATKGLIAYSQNIIATDSAGSILYTGFQGVPCRENLPLDEDGWGVGANPTQLLDGTTYGGWTVPIGDDGKVVFDHPDHCIVAWDDYPHSFDPAQGYLLTANNDWGGLSFDDDVTNDGPYLGGPWSAGYRADSIDSWLALSTTAGTSDIADQQALQAHHESRMGQQFGPLLLEGIESADDPTQYDEVASRIQAWLDAGAPAESGVETFYNPLDPGEEDHAVATMIFNAWFGRFMSGVFDDEGLPGVWEPWGSTGRTRALTLIVDGRGPGNPSGLGSWNPDTEESAFFDTLGTEEIETSADISLAALDSALEFLRSPDEKDSLGGFGTEDMSQWLWGYKHVVRFNSLLAGFLGDDFSAFTDPFSINTDTLDIGEHPYDLNGFPRWGDNFAVDAANNGFGHDDFDYGSGPVFRMVIALGPDGVEGENIIPGGQSALNDSDFFADQAALWLANETLPMHFEVEKVVAHASGREVLHPLNGSADCSF